MADIHTFTHTRTHTLHTHSDADAYADSLIAAHYIKSEINNYTSMNKFDRIQ